MVYTTHNLVIWGWFTLAVQPLYHSLYPHRQFGSSAGGSKFGRSRMGPAQLDTSVARTSAWRGFSVVLFNEEIVILPRKSWFYGISWRIPSGKLKKLWKITIFNGKIHYKWPFSIATLNYQRVLMIFKAWGLSQHFWGLSQNILGIWWCHANNIWMTLKRYPEYWRDEIYPGIEPDDYIVIKHLEKQKHHDLTSRCHSHL